MVRQILLVEDSQDDVDLMLRAFRRAEVEGQIVVSRDGPDALDYLFATGRHEGRDALSLPHVVLLDLKLPLMDGLEVLRRLRTDPRTKLLPVVVLTSSLEAGDLASSYDFGANSYVQKPVDSDDFQEAVRQIASYWLLLNREPPVL